MRKTWHAIGIISRIFSCFFSFFLLFISLPPYTYTLFYIRLVSNVPISLFTSLDSAVNIYNNRARDSREPKVFSTWFISSKTRTFKQRFRNNIKIHGIRSGKETEKRERARDRVWERARDGVCERERRKKNWQTSKQKMEKDSLGNRIRHLKIIVIAMWHSWKANMPEQSTPKCNQCVPETTMPKTGSGFSSFFFLQLVGTGYFVQRARWFVSNTAGQARSLHMLQF